MKRCFALLASALFITAPSAFAASHQWRFNEVFSNEDGTIQFIELKESAGATQEWEMQDKWILAVGADRKFTFRSNIQGNTANKHYLLATQGFADLEEAPTPDVIIPAGFLPTGAETLEYWMYGDATWSYPGLPTDGITSRTSDGNTGVNTPTNFAGETGTVDLTIPVESMTWGQIKARFGDELTQ